MSAELLSQTVCKRMSFPKALSGRYEPRQDLPDWMRVPRWCTTDSPPWDRGQTAALVNGFADRYASVLRLGTFWGGLAMFPSEFAPRSPRLKPGVDPLAEAIAAVRQRKMRLLAYINPNAYYEQNPLYATASLVAEDGQTWDIKAYGKTGTRYACSNHPAFAEFYVKAIREVIGRYGADGIYVDGLSPHVCYCHHCRAKFKADTGRDLPAGLMKIGPICVLWEMTSDWDVIGDVQNPDHVLYSQWLMKCLHDITKLFSETARAARPGAVVVFHSWPKPDILKYYDGTLNEIYANKPWNFTLWKRAEFSNWGDVFEIPSLVNIYLRQETWGLKKRQVTSEAEARHMYWQTLANGGFPNSWAYPGMERPFEVMKRHADCFDFSTTFPTKFIALARPMFTDARHRTIASDTLIPLRPGKQGRLRILEREPNGKIDLLCLRADNRAPTDQEYADWASGRPIPNVTYLRACAFDPKSSILAAEGRAWKVRQDPQALAGAFLTSVGHGTVRDPIMRLEYELPELASPGPWSLWARVVFPGVGSDSFFWQVSNNGGRTWIPEKPRDDCALGWEQPKEYAWVKARVALGLDPEIRIDRFLSPAAGMFAGLLHAGLPVKEMHPNHITRKSLEGFHVLVLANEVCLSDEQCALIRDFVREGGGLIASHETSLYDLEARRRQDFGLAAVFGASLRGVIGPRPGQQVVARDPLPNLPLPGEGLPNHEEHLEVSAQGSKVLAWLTGPGTPEGGAPALLLNEYGRGRVAYLPGRLDSSYAFWADKAFPSIVESCVVWVSGGDLPASILSPKGIVGLTCFDQPSRRRRLIHLVSYNADWVEGFDRLGPVQSVRLLIKPPEGAAVLSAQEILSGTMLAPIEREDKLEIVLPQLDEYAIIAVNWR